VKERIPRLGLGTFGRTGEEGLEAILTALELGYRHLDTAQTYHTETVIAEALRRSALPAHQVFITTKVADTHLESVNFLPSVRASLDRLQRESVDLLLIHWPSQADVVPFEEYVDALGEAKALGLARQIGVSNFPAALVDRAVARLGPGEVATNQVECHPFLQNRVLRGRCAAHGVVVTAYMPLAAGRVITDSTIHAVAKRVGESPPTVTLAWLFDKGMVAIPASSRRAHLAANLRAIGLRLSADDVAAIDSLDRGERLVNPTKSPVWD
jgi:2,5-diketo-D-gluconate reductase B